MFGSMVRSVLETHFMEVDTRTVLVTAVVGLLVYYLYRKMQQPYDTIRSWGFTPYPNHYPLLGHYTTDEGTFDRAMLKKCKHKRVVALVGLRTPSLNVLDKELIKHILVKDFHAFSDRFLLAMGPAPLNSSVFNLSEDHWKHVRSTVSPTLTSGKLKSMHTLLSGAAQNAINYLEDKTHEKDGKVVFARVNAKEFFTRFTIDAVASSLFGLDMDSHNKNYDHPFVHHALTGFNVSLTNPWVLLGLLLPEFIHVFAGYGSYLMRNCSLGYFKDIVENILKERRRNPDFVRHDFINAIASSEIADEDLDRESVHKGVGHVHRWSSKGLTKNEILSQGVAFMAAGFETTATTLHMLAYCLATHLDIQDKVREEINEVIGEQKPSYDDLIKLPYLDMCIQETLRIFPPAGRTERRCNQTITIDGITFKEGSHITIPFYAQGMDPEEYEEPDNYVPERFDKDAKQARHQFSYLPFGAGPRNCIGMRLAWYEMRLLMVKILQKFRIEPTENTKMFHDLEFRYKGFLQVIDPIELYMVPV